jgi:chorismate dehydratase
MIRLGRISYVNMAPVFFELEAEVEEVSGVPTDLNERLIGGEIDLAPISSIAYGRHAGRLRILPRL